IEGTWDGVSVNGDGDGIDVDGVLNLTNNGSVLAHDANGNGTDGFPNGPDGVAAGGGTITNARFAEIRAGVTGGNAKFSQGILMDNSSRGNEIASTTLTNDGSISSDQGPAIIFIGDATKGPVFPNSITNDTHGLISGAETLPGADHVAGAVIQTGDGNDTIINRGSATGTGLTTIQTGGTLGGSGIVGAVTLQSGGNITPNDGITEILHTGAVTFVSGANFKVQLNGTAGNKYDQLLATGNVAL